MKNVSKPVLKHDLYVELGDLLHEEIESWLNSMEHHDPDELLDNLLCKEEWHCPNLPSDNNV